MVTGKGRNRNNWNGWKETFELAIQKEKEAILASSTEDEQHFNVIAPTEDMDINYESPIAESQAPEGTIPNMESENVFENDKNLDDISFKINCATCEIVRKDVVLLRQEVAKQTKLMAEMQVTINLMMEKHL